MFGIQKETLIVVYKDELYVNQLKKLVESNDDEKDKINGVKDNTVNIVSWSEKQWMSNKQAGNIAGKILFLGNVKETDKLIPVIDIKFNKYGVKYGWAGNQAILFIDTNEISSIEKYKDFLHEIDLMPIPDQIRNANRDKFFTTNSNKSTDTNNILKPMIPLEDELETADIDSDRSESDKKNETFEKVKETAQKGFKFLNKAFKNAESELGSTIKNISIKTDNTVKKQMMFYGLIKFYNDSLDSFINS